VDTWTSKYVPTYGYEFNDENAPERFLQPASYGAAHESELQYLFGLPNPPTMYPGTLTAAQQRLAASMQRYWTNFAAQGSPSSTGQPPRPAVETDFAVSHHCAFWAAAG